MKLSHLQQTTMAAEMAQEHASVRPFLGSTDPGNPRCYRAGVQGQYKALGVLPHWWQDQFMAKLHKELGQCPVRAGLCGAMGTGVGGTHGPAFNPELGNPQQTAGGRRLPSGWEVDPWWGTHGPKADAVGAEQSSTSVSPQGANKQVRHLPRLPWDPTGVPFHLQAHCTHTALMSNCTAH